MVREDCREKNGGKEREREGREKREEWRERGGKEEESEDH